MNYIHKIIILFLISFNSIICLGQHNIKIEYISNDTCISTTVNEYDRLLRHVIPDKKEITRLYKVNLFKLARQKLNFSIEHALNKKFTLEHEAVFHIVGYSNYKLFTQIETMSFSKFSNKTLYYLTLSSNLKYYHNLDNRIARGKNTNGFSGNYFITGFTIKAAFYDTDIWHLGCSGYLSPNSYDSYFEKHNPIFVLTGDNTESYGCFMFGYGLQRRIGNIGYWGAEAKIGIGTNKFFDTVYIPVELNLKVGFALSSLKRKR